MTALAKSIGREPWPRARAEAGCSHAEETRKVEASRGARAAMVIFLISLVGVPPLAGFVGKFLLFGAAIEAGFTWLAVVAILNSVLSLAVYLRIVVPMYQTPKEAPTSTRAIAAVWAVALVATVAVGIAAQALLGEVS